MDSLYKGDVWDRVAKKVKANGEFTNVDAQADKEILAKYKHGAYYDTTVAAEAKKQYGEVEKLLKKKENKDLTPAEKVKKLKDLFGTAKTKIDEKYAAALKLAQDKATNQAKALYNNGEKTELLDKETSTKFLNKALEEIKAAKTVEEVSKVVDKTAKVDTSLFGSYDETERLRKVAKDEVKDGMKGIEETLQVPTTTEAAEKYKALAEKLEGYGIDKLPADVCKDYLKQVATAESFEYTVDKDGNNEIDKTKLGQAGQKAVSDSYKNIVSTLRKAVKKSYDDEIYASEVLVDTKDRDNASTAVENIMAKWFTDNSETKTIEKMLSYSYTEQGSDNGLLGCIEEGMKGWNVEFTAERLSNKRAKVMSELKAYYNAILNGDEVYKAILATKASGNNGDLLQADDCAALVEKYGLKAESAIAVYNGQNTNIKKELVKVLGEKLDGEGGSIKNTTKIGDLGTLEDATKRTLDSTYGTLGTNASGALKVFKESEDVDLILGNNTKYIKKETLEAAYYDLFVGKDEDGNEVVLTKTLTDILNSVKGSEHWVAYCEDLDTKYKAWVDHFDGGENPIDSKMKEHAEDSTSKVWEAILEQVNDILTGAATGSSNDSVIASLDTLYVEDVANYLDSNVALLEVLKNATVSELVIKGNVADSLKLEKVYNAVMALKGVAQFKYTIGNNNEQTVVVNKGASYAGVDKFVEAVTALLKADTNTVIKINGTEIK